MGEQFDPKNLVNGYMRKFSELRTPNHVLLSKLQTEFHLNFKLKLSNNENNFYFIDPIDQLCIEKKINREFYCDVVDNLGLPIYRDQDHFSATYMKRNITWFNDLLQISI